MPSGVPIVVLTGTVLGLVALRIGAFRLMVGGWLSAGCVRTYQPFLDSGWRDS